VHAKEVKMNKKGFAKMQGIGIGAIVGIIGIIFMSFGASLGSILMLRIGAVLTTIGAWLIQWSK